MEQSIVNNCSFPDYIVGYHPKMVPKHNLSMLVIWYLLQMGYNIRKRGCLLDSLRIIHNLILDQYPGFCVRFSFTSTAEVGKGQQT